jgi:lipoprotein NlpI
VIPFFALVSLLAAVAPAGAEDLLTSARAALVRGDTDRALPLADSAVEAAPDKPAPYALRTAVHEARRDFGKTIDDCTKVLSLTPEDPAALHRRGAAHFRLGHFNESVADFDREVALDPSREPYHWQRGISLYYAGEYARGARQFELHRTVNGDDVENAAWHYLCVARSSGVEKARQSLLPVGPDRRVPMKEAYELFAGRVAPQAVIDAATKDQPPEPQRNQRLFYAHLYVALYHDAAGEVDKAREHTRLAVKYADDDYMGDVVRVHAAALTPVPK